MPIRLKRVYAPAQADDGRRYLVDRLWPRGITKERLPLTAWLKDIAPSSELRRWFGHDPSRYPQFRARYREELRPHESVLRHVALEGSNGTVTLLYAARDEEHCNATVLREVLDRMIRGEGIGRARDASARSRTASAALPRRTNRQQRR